MQVVDDATKWQASRAHHVVLRKRGFPGSVRIARNWRRFVHAFCLCNLPIGLLGAFRGLCLCPGKLRFPTAKVALVGSRFECWVSAPESQASRAALTIRQASLHRQIRRFLTFQYAVDVIGRTSELVGNTRPIGDQSASSNKRPWNVYGGQLVARGSRDDQIGAGSRYRTRRHDYSSIGPLREPGDGRFNLVWLAQVDWAYFDANRWRHRLNDGKLADPGGGGRITKHCGMRQSRCSTQ
jgi:hypothetical protein